jgi:hypothetical protein
MVFSGKILRNPLVPNIKSWKKYGLADGIGFFGDIFI